MQDQLGTVTADNANELGRNLRQADILLGLELQQAGEAATVVCESDNSSSGMQEATRTWIKVI